MSGWSASFSHKRLERLSELRSSLRETSKPEASANAVRLESTSGKGSSLRAKAASLLGTEQPSGAEQHRPSFSQFGSTHAEVFPSLANTVSSLEQEHQSSAAAAEGLATHGAQSHAPQMSWDRRFRQLSSKSSGSQNGLNSFTSNTSSNPRAAAAPPADQPPGPPLNQPPLVAPSVEPAGSLLGLHKEAVHRVTQQLSAADAPDDELWEWEAQHTRKTNKARKKQPGTGGDEGDKVTGQAGGEFGDAQTGRARGRSSTTAGRQKHKATGQALSGALMELRAGAGDDENGDDRGGTDGNDDSDDGGDDGDEGLLLCADADGDVMDTHNWNPEGGSAALQLCVPASISRHLHPYQKAGVKFLFRQYARGKGGVLADDMGLGKTVQCIAFCAAVLGKGVNGSKQAVAGSDDLAHRWPILIVCPTSVLTNWGRELDSWGRFRVDTYHGAARSTALHNAQTGASEVVLTTYDMIRLNPEEVVAVNWHMAFFDEAHKLKNIKSHTYKACRKLRTSLRYGLTGTVMSNNYDELWTLMDFVAPASLGDRSHFREYYSLPMQLAQKADATSAMISKGRARQKQLLQLLSKFLLRRTKSNTMRDQLPSKRDHIVFCQLSTLQLRAYRRVLSSPDFQLLVNHDTPCACGSGLKQGRCCKSIAPKEVGGVLWPHYHCCTCANPWDAFTNPKGCKFHRPEGCYVEGVLRCPLCLVLPCLTLLQKISNHLELLKLDPTSGDPRDIVQAQRNEEIVRFVLGEDLDEAGGVHLQRSFLSSSDASVCGKLVALESMMSLWISQPGVKVLCFSHSTRMLTIIERLVIRKGYSYLRLDGSSPQQERQRLADEFNASASVFLFLISTTAGGIGLNLTAANKVVIFDPSWNPAHDLQAQDRAFRIGQQRDVSVYRLIAGGTMEECVYNRQLYKQQQSAVAIGGATEKRYFKGVQGVRQEQGELFGITNLFKLTADAMHTAQHPQQQDSADGNGVRLAVHVPYRVEELDIAVDLEEADGQPDELPATLGDVGDIGGIEDVGLGALARVCVKGLEDSSNPARETKHRDQLEASKKLPTGMKRPHMSPTLDSPTCAELAVLEEGGGVVGIHRHDNLLAATSTGMTLRTGDDTAGDTGTDAVHRQGVICGDARDGDMEGADIVGSRGAPRGTLKNNAAVVGATRGSMREAGSKRLRQTVLNPVGASVAGHTVESATAEKKSLASPQQPRTIVAFLAHTTGITSSEAAAQLVRMTADERRAMQEQFSVFKSAHAS